MSLFKKYAKNLLFYKKFGNILSVFSSGSIRTTLDKIFYILFLIEDIKSVTGFSLNYSDFIPFERLLLC